MAATLSEISNLTALQFIIVSADCCYRTSVPVPESIYDPLLIRVYHSPSNYCRDSSTITQSNDNTMSFV